tara:strand:- start:186 stop:347 length:162 start_codon:yes stop_codon:yes gene_type:complete
MRTPRKIPLTLLILQQSEKSRWQTGKKSAAFFKIILDISNQGVMIMKSKVAED